MVHHWHSIPLRTAPLCETVMALTDSMSTAPMWCMELSHFDSESEAQEHLYMEHNYMMYVQLCNEVLLYVPTTISVMLMVALPCSLVTLHWNAPVSSMAALMITSSSLLLIMNLVLAPGTLRPGWSPPAG